MIPIIPYQEFEFSFARSSGPGGQNVNKVSSKVLLKWNVLESPSLSEEIRERLIAKLGQKITNDGNLIVTCDTFRDQPRNKEECVEKFYKILTTALFVPKTRKKTKPSRASTRRVKEAKSHNSSKKQLRKSPKHSD
jgi:ribosome-associated protein